MSPLDGGPLLDIAHTEKGKNEESPFKNLERENGYSSRAPRLSIVVSMMALLQRPHAFLPGLFGNTCALASSFSSALGGS